MSQITEKRIFYISSGEYLTSTNNTFKTSLQIPEYEDYDHITLLQASIPVSYYIVTAGYNTFHLIENGVSTLITIPEGNYNANSFSQVVSALLNSSSPNHLTYTITYPVNFTQNNTGKFTFMVNSLLPISFSFSSSNYLNQQFGFYQGSNNTFTAGIGSSTLVSTSVISFIPESTIFLHCDIVNSPGNNQFSDTLQEIFFGNNTILGQQVYVNPDPIASSKKMKSKSRVLTFSITDENGLPIYFNGVNIVFTIMLYKDADFYKTALVEYKKAYDLNNEIKNILISLNEGIKANTSKIESLILNLENRISNLENLALSKPSIEPIEGAENPDENKIVTPNQGFPIAENEELN